MLWILSAVAISVVVGCPKDVMRRVRQCMNPLEMYSADHAGILMLMSSLDKTSQLCSEGKIQNAFSCLNNLYNKCAQSREGTQHFDLLVDVGKWRQAMDNICNNIHYLQDHEECEAQAYQEYKPCADEEVASFSQQMAAMWAELGNQGQVSEEQKTEAMMDVGCSFTIKILDCLRNPFTKFCPKQLTNLLVNTVEDFMPPACVKRALINSINKIPRYKHVSHEKHHTHTSNIVNNTTTTNNTSSFIINVVVMTTSPTTSKISDQDMLNNLSYAEGDQGQVKVIGLFPGRDGVKEAIGSASSSQGEIENRSISLTVDFLATIILLLSCNLFIAL